MANFRFELLTTAELLDIRDYVHELLKSRAANERREIEKTLVRIADATGESAGSRRANLKGAKIAPKFRNPQTGETWAGRGARPRWLQAQLRLGHKLQDFAIAADAAAWSEGGRQKRAASRGRKKSTAKPARQKRTAARARQKPNAKRVRQKR
jgi:DNA-binding protein H-NS